MRVYLNLNALPTAGGMFRVLDGLSKHLPAKGIEFVDSPDKADVYHAHIGLYENISPQLPLVVSSHGMLWDSVWGSAWSTNKHLIEAYNQADVITTPSHFVAESIARNTLMKPLVVHHGIDIDKWTPSTNDGYVLWNKARVDSANDPNDLQQLAHDALNIKFKTTFGEKTDNVDVLGLVDPDQMRDIVSHAGVYLDTALESGGPCFGVLEALACGVPVLAWNNGGNAEVINKDIGYLAQPGNYADLLAGLHYCLTNRDRLSRNARQLAIEKYQWHIVIDGYIEAYQKAIDLHKHSNKVSVIIPCYNLSKFLPNCLESVITQTFQDWEAIVVDDASTDNSYEIAQQYAQKDVRIKLFKNDTNQHVANTRNRAVTLSHGEYIFPLDADDRLVADALEKLVNKLDSDRSLQIATGTLLVCGEEDLSHGYNGGWPNNTEYNLQMDGYNRLPYASMYRRKVWNKIGGYRRRIRNGIEDADFWTRALSYGCKAEILPDTTLLYTQRASSLRTKNARGAAAWLEWFPWGEDRDKSPFSATGFGPYKVDIFTPKVSVIIPVGPGHEHHIQGCLDSLLAQDFTEWEAIVINDTGQRWFDDNGNELTPMVLGYSFVTFVDTDKNSGVAHARNLGIQHARTDRIVFLDVDDIAQPFMLDILLKAHLLSDGWIYGDWVVYDGEKTSPSQAPDWTPDGLMKRSLAPITGIYHKKHIEEVGGFDEQAPGWEDWDMQLGLLENGICGTRIRYPLMSYHMHLGARREDNFSQRQDLVKYIVDKHPLLYGKGAEVACRKCGGHPTLNVLMNATAPQPEEALVLIKYVGPETNYRLFKSPSKPHQPPYKVSSQEPFFVLPADVNHFLSRVGFQLVEQPKPAQVVGQESPQPLVSDAERVHVPQEKPVDWDTLSLKPEVITILKNSFPTLKDVVMASDASLLSTKGIGEARLRDIRRALINVAI